MQCTVIGICQAQTLVSGSNSGYDFYAGLIGFSTIQKKSHYENKQTGKTIHFQHWYTFKKINMKKTNYICFLQIMNIIIIFFLL